MDAQTLLTSLTSWLDERWGPQDFDSQPPFAAPQGVGPFGKTLTDRWTQPVMVDGERFFLTVEKDPNQ
jgi:hypothetical protein